MNPKYENGDVNWCLTCSMFPLIDCGYLKKRKTNFSIGYLITTWCPGYNKKVRDEHNQRSE